jgi:hypothetical protein
MGTSSLYDWSTTAANNASITGSSINWAENQAPSTINNSAREEMREVALWRDLLGGAKIATGTNTLALTTGLTLAAYAQGMMFAFENTTQNTGAVTINVDTIGAKDIKKFHDQALASGDLEAAGIYIIAYEATAGNFQLLSSVSSGGGISNVVEDTTPQLGGQLDVNGNALGDGTLELLKFSETGSAVNEFTIANAASGAGPTLSATGTDSNVDINISAKGTGVVAVSGSMNPSLTSTGKALVLGF